MANNKVQPSIAKLLNKRKKVSALSLGHTIIPVCHQIIEDHDFNKWHLDAVCPNGLLFVIITLLLLPVI